MEAKWKFEAKRKQKNWFYWFASKQSEILDVDEAKQREKKIQLFSYEHSKRKRFVFLWSEIKLQAKLAQPRAAIAQLREYETEDAKSLADWNFKAGWWHRYFT